MACVVIGAPFTGPDAVALGRRVGGGNLNLLQSSDAAKNGDGVGTRQIAWI
jgi:hypothetical protein